MRSWSSNNPSLQQSIRFLRTRVPLAFDCLPIQINSMWGPEQQAPQVHILARRRNTARTSGDDRNRTCTTFRPLDPKSSASANSATSPHEWQEWLVYAETMS